MLEPYSIMIETFLNSKIFILAFAAGFLSTFLIPSYNWKEVSKTEEEATQKSIRKPRKVKGECKMVFVVRKDLKTTKREIASYCVHACIEAYKECLVKEPKIAEHWIYRGTAKVALKINDEAELLAVKKHADERGLINYLVQDNTSSHRSALLLAIGPDTVEEINNVTGHLKLY